MIKADAEANMMTKINEQAIYMAIANLMSLLLCLTFPMVKYVKINLCK